MDSMQAEALRRAQEMHSGQRRRSSSSDTSQRVNPNTNTDKSGENHSAEKEETSKAQEESRQGFPQKDFASARDFPVSALFEDKEKLLIIVLILMLISEEKADTFTILALLYLII